MCLLLVNGLTACSSQRNFEKSNTLEEKPSAAWNMAQTSQVGPRSPTHEKKNVHKAVAPPRETKENQQQTEAKPTLRVEARGVWVTRWDYHSSDDVANIMDDALVGGFNQVYFQVRGVADAYYTSSIEPWAAALAGKLGRDPGWDPLAEAIAQAHRRGLELHAWINLCTAWKGKKPPGFSRPRHVLRAHPSWRVVRRSGRVMPYTDGAYVFVNPANPDFQDHVVQVVSEIANYDVDGVHLDYARYPGADTSFDRTTKKLFWRARREARPKKLSRAQWQRQELTQLVKRIKTAVLDQNPAAVVSAAVTGIYLDRWGWGSVTQGKLDFYQDSYSWAENKAVDTLIPMIYWKPTRTKGGRTDYLTLVEDFCPLANLVHLLIGINVEAGDFGMLEREIQIARDDQTHGFVLFAYATIKARGWFKSLGEGVFAKDALPPPKPVRTNP
jgi:uncharacterized lipoprotein YddW (UPF0748 family)